MIVFFLVFFSFFICLVSLPLFSCLSKYMCLLFHARCVNCKVCEVCRSVDNEANASVESELELLYCEQCDRAYHLKCLAPKLSAVPNGHFVCGLCVACTACTKPSACGAVAIAKQLLREMPPTPSATASAAANQSAASAGAGATACSVYNGRSSDSAVSTYVSTGAAPGGGGGSSGGLGADSAPLALPPSAPPLLADSNSNNTAGSAAHAAAQAMKAQKAHQSRAILEAASFPGAYWSSRPDRCLPCANRFMLTFATVCPVCRVAWDQVRITIDGWCSCSCTFMVLFLVFLLLS